MGFALSEVPKYTIKEGLRKPDLVAFLERMTLVLDFQIVSEHADLDVANRRKTSYYQNNPCLSGLIKEEKGTGDIHFLGITIN